MIAIAPTRALDRSSAFVQQLVEALKRDPKQRTNVQLLREIGDHVQVIVQWAELLLGVDRRLVASVPNADRTAIAEQATKRAASAQYLVTARPLVIYDVPQLERFWTAELHERAQLVVVDSMSFVVDLQRNILPSLPPERPATTNLRYAPVVFGETPREIDEHVLAYCDRSDLSSAVFTAAQIAWETFQGASGFNIRLGGDADSNDTWVTIDIRVPDDDTLGRFNRYIVRLLAEVPSDAVSRIDLRYDIE